MINETDLAYIAGYFDGDGSFNTPLVKQRKGFNLGFVVRASAEFGTTDLGVLAWIHERLNEDGIVCFMLKSYRVTPSGRPYSLLSVSRLSSVAAFCHRVGPHLIAKKRQMEIMRDELLPLLMGKGRRWWTEDQLYHAREIKARIDALKQQPLSKRIRP